MTPDDHRTRTPALTAIQQTLLPPLYARAAEADKAQPLLYDEQAVRITAALDHEPVEFPDSADHFAAVARTCILDVWTRKFLSAHPEGTVVELGTGLSSRSIRLDNGACHWIDLDLPEVIDLRRRFFTDTDRCAMVAASVLETPWLQVVAERPGPPLFLAEAVLPYLRCGDAHRVLHAIATRFPAATIAFDTYGHRAVRHSRRRDTGTATAAPIRWTCEDPAALVEVGVTLRESRNLAQTQPVIRRSLPLATRLQLHAAARLNLRGFADHRINLFHAQARDQLRNPGG